jgi:hypothetical protein
MWLPIIGHFLNNGIAVIAYFLINKNLLNANVENIGSTSNSYYLAAISMVLVITFMWMLKRQNAENFLPLEKEL